jgi:NADPH:quinone reductase-like Zn-dependent oxidoreductase
MKAALYTRYGSPDVVALSEVPRPLPPAHGVIVRVRATTVSSGDARLRSANVPPGFGLLLRLGFGVFGPRKRVLGTEVAGEVVEVGAHSRFAVGDRVFALLGAGLGGHAEYVAIPDSGAIASLPRNLSFEQGAAVAFGGATALHYLRDKAKLRAGERLVVNGASGAVGSAAVQLAKHLGAHVTAVCSSDNAELVTALGADRVIDHTRQDFTTAGDRYDVILDTVGNCSYARCAPALADNGRLLLVVAGLGQMLGALLRPVRSGHRLLCGVTPERAEDLHTLANLAETGAYRPLIDGTFPFDRIADAHARVDSRRKRGNVVVTLGAA